MEEDVVVVVAVVVAVVEVKEKVVQTNAYKTDAFCSHLFRRRISKALALFVQLSILEFIFFIFRYPVMSYDPSSNYTIPKVVIEIIYIYSNMMPKNPISYKLRIRNFAAICADISRQMSLNSRH